MRPEPKPSMVHLCFMTNNTFRFIFISTLYAPASLCGWTFNGMIKSLEDIFRACPWTNWTSRTNMWNLLSWPKSNILLKRYGMPKLWWTRKGPAMIGVQDHYLLAVVRFGPSESDLGWSCSRWVWSIWAAQGFIKRGLGKILILLLRALTSW